MSPFALVTKIPVPSAPVHARHQASIAETVSHLLSSAGKFFSQLTQLHWIPLMVGLMLYLGYLAMRSRALFNALRAAYPQERVRYRDVWGAYMVGNTVNAVLPLGGGNIAQLFLTRTSIEASSYPTVASALSTGVVFDYFAGILVMLFAFTQGVFPKPPDFSKLPAFDISFFAGHMRFTLFLITVTGVGFLVAFALLSARVRAFWERVRQGYTILRNRRRYRNEMGSWQAGAWLMRFGCYWALLDAFHIGGSVRNALLVLGVQVVASLFPFTPGGAGVQQALLLTVFASSASGPTVAAFSIGQQIATSAATAVVGFGALILIFRLRSFREVIRKGREDRGREDRPASDGDGGSPPEALIARWP